jgi:putative membrane protein
MHLVVRFIINALAFFLIAKYVPGFNHNITPWTAAIAALVFGIVNALLGPILHLIALPFTILTFGIFAIVVNYALFAITVWLVPSFHPTGEINPWLANLYGAAIMMVVSGLVRHSSRSEEERTRR